MTAFIVDSLDPKKAGKVLLFNEVLEICEKKSPAKIITFREQVLHGFKRFYLVGNSLHTTEQEKAVEEFRAVIGRFLSLEMSILGVLPFEAAMDNALAQQTPFIAKYPDSGFARSIEQMAANLMAGINH
jgi:MinD-like ATPase involved in chromosome partitioning or flagellar assembly